MDLDDGQDQRETSTQEQQESTNPPRGERQGKSPFLRQMSEVERQGVPEPGVVNPGPPPKPVRSGDFRADQAPNAEQGEEQ